MKSARNLTVSMLATVLALLIALGGGAAASAAPPSGSDGIRAAIASVAPADDSQIDAIQAAFASAAAGDDHQLDALLKGPLVDRTRAELAASLQARGDLDFDTTDLVEPGPELLRTGEYEYTCTGYNGVEMGWNGKVERACHGWMNVYISGKHVAHYCPDLFPSSVGAISFSCFFTAGVAAAHIIFGIVTAGWGALGMSLLEGAVGIPLAC